MTTRTYLFVSGAVFGLIAVIHVLRLVNHWSAQLAGQQAPTWLSWAALVLSAGLCIWSFSLAARKK